MERSDNTRVEFQLTDMGRLGDLLLKWFADGHLWDDQILIVPESLVPKREKSFDSGADSAAE
jgi:hypothetical protein